MKKTLRALVPVSMLLLMCLTTPASAATELDRPVLSQVQEHDIQLWLQQDYVSPSLDFTGYQKSTGGATLDRYEESKIGFRYGLTDNLNIRYVIGYQQQDASRVTAPKSINSKAYSHDLKLQYQYDVAGVHLGVEVGYRAHKAKQVKFYDYQFANTLVTFGGKPLVTLDAKDQAWTGALRGAWEIADDWILHAGIEARRVRISTSMTSASSLIRSLLAPFAPQSTPWNETHLLFQTALDWQPMDILSLSLDYTHYQIFRSKYQPARGKQDYNAQDQLDGFITWHINEHWSTYGHARVNTHFILGDIPMAYNRRVNHKFKKAFGFVSFGMNVTY